MPVGMLFGWLLLYFVSRLVERGAPFYAAAVLFTLLYVAFTEMIMPGSSEWTNIVRRSIFILPTVTISLYLLDKYSETIANWLAIYTVTIIVLLFLP